MSFRPFLASLVVSLLCACNGPVSNTNQLMPGMTQPQVKQLMGEPSQTQFVSDKLVWKYMLWEAFKGTVPYYLVFGRESQTLERWYADEAEYMRQQQLWIQALPPTQKYEVDLKVTQPAR